MKKLTLCILLIFSIFLAKGQNTEYLQKKDFLAEKTRIYENINMAKKISPELKRLLSMQTVKIDSLSELTGRVNALNSIYLDTIRKLSLRVKVMENAVIRYHDKTKMNFIYIILVSGGILILMLASLAIMQKQIESHKRKIAGMMDLIKKSEDEINRIKPEIKDLASGMKSAIDQSEAKYLELRQVITGHVSSLDERITDSLRKINNYQSKYQEEVDHVCAEYRQQHKILNEKITGLTEQTGVQLNELRKQLADEIHSLAEEIRKREKS